MCMHIYHIHAVFVFVHIYTICMQSIYVYAYIPLLSFKYEMFPHSLMLSELLCQMSVIVELIISSGYYLINELSP